MLSTRARNILYNMGFREVYNKDFNEEAGKEKIKEAIEKGELTYIRKKNVRGCGFGRKAFLEICEWAGAIPPRKQKVKSEREIALEKSLRRCLAEAEEWIDEARGCKPSNIMDYDGWAEEAHRLLEES